MIALTNNNGTAAAAAVAQTLKCERTFICLCPKRAAATATTTVHFGL